MRGHRVALLVSASVLAVAVSLGAADAPVAAQGWSPFPDRDPPSWSRQTPRKPAGDAGQDGRGPDGSLPATPVQAQGQAQGWSPSPRSAAERAAGGGGTASRPDAGVSDDGSAPSQSGLPEPGRGRPPGYLGELRGSEGPPPNQPPGKGAAGDMPPSRGGSIIPDRQLPDRRSPERAPNYGWRDDPAPGQLPPARQVAPASPPPGGYRPYYGQSPAQGRGQGQIQGEIPSRDSRAAAGHSAPSGETWRPPAAGSREATVQGGAGQRGREVDAQELPPVMSADGSRMPVGLWQGITVPEVEQLMAGLAMPPRSAALHELWRRLLLAKGSEPAGGKTPTHFLALRLAALYRLGLLDDLQAATDAAGETSKGDGDGDIVLAVQRAKAQLGLGQREAACESARAAKYQGEVPRPIAQDALLLIAYCAAADGNPAAASLTADLAREQRMEAPLAFAVIEHLASGAAAGVKPKLAIPKDVTLLDYRYLELAGAHEGVALLERAEPALVSALTREVKADARLRIGAAEDAARIFALDAPALMAAYREAAIPAAGDPLTAKLPPPLKRAALAQAIDKEANGARKLRLMQALLAEARSHTLYVPVAKALAPLLKGMRQTPDLAPLAETAIEIALAGADYGAAVSWATFGSAYETAGPAHGRPDGLMHWMTLVDIAGAKAFVPRGSGLKLTEELAVRGKLPAPLMHRLVTVLDALEYDIPIPLWDAASRTPQPATGHLPETGVLPRLKDAAAGKKYALTVLLVMQSLGAEGAEGAHLLALGDSIRALRAAGLEEDARRLGFEALFAAWPRSAGG